MDSGQCSRPPEAGLRTASGGREAGEQQLAAVPSVRDKVEKLIESIAEKFGEASSSVIPAVVNMLRERLSVVVGAEGASPSTTSQIENKGGFGTTRERKRLSLFHISLKKNSTVTIFSELISRETRKKK